MWQNVVRAFKDAPSEKQWVELAEKAASASGSRIPANEQRWGPVRETLSRARQLRDDGKVAEAEQIWQGLEELYRDDASAVEILQEVRRDRSTSETRD